MKKKRKMAKITIDPNDPNYTFLNLIKIDLNTLRSVIVALQKDGFVEIGLADLLWHIKSATMEEKVDS